MEHSLQALKQNLLERSKSHYPIPPVEIPQATELDRYEMMLAPTKAPGEKKDRDLYKEMKEEFGVDIYSEPTDTSQ